MPQAVQHAGMVTITTREPAQVRYHGNYKLFYFDSVKNSGLRLNSDLISCICLQKVTFQSSAVGCQHKYYLD